MRQNAALCGNGLNFELIVDNNNSSFDFIGQQVTENLTNFAVANCQTYCDTMIIIGMAKIYLYFTH